MQEICVQSLGWEGRTEASSENEDAVVHQPFGWCSMTAHSFYGIHFKKKTPGKDSATATSHGAKVIINMPVSSELHP